MVGVGGRGGRKEGKGGKEGGEGDGGSGWKSNVMLDKKNITKIWLSLTEMK